MLQTTQNDIHCHGEVLVCGDPAIADRAMKKFKLPVIATVICKRPRLHQVLSHTDIGFESTCKFLRFLKTDETIDTSL